MQGGVQRAPLSCSQGHLTFRTSKASSTPQDQRLRPSRSRLPTPVARTEATPDELFVSLCIEQMSK